MDRRSLLAAGAGLCLPGSAFAQAGGGMFSSALSYSAAQSPSAVLIARHGIVLAESYIGASAGMRWDLGQAGRLFAPILAASLIEDRMMSLSEPVAMTLGDWGADPVKSTITMRALLNGTSGIAAGRRDDLTLTEAIALEPRATPGQRFIDDSTPYLLFGEIARRKVQSRGGNLDIGSYLSLRVLDDIGCTPVAWARTREGAPRLDGGMQTNLRAFAQAGELIRREGVFQAQEFGDGEAMREARQASFAERRAGMGLWLAGGLRGASPDMEVESDLWRTSPAPPLDLAMAAGENGQRLYIAPSEGLLIARLGRNGGSWSDAAFLGSVLSAL